MKLQKNQNQYEEQKQEIWKEIHNSTGYFVSNFGRVKNKKRITKGGKIKSYLRVCVKYKDGKYLDKKVHRLVAEAFIDNPSNLETVNHKDYNGFNNHFSNLEWMSLKDNILHGKKQGKCMPNGLSVEKVLTIYTFHLAKYPGRYSLCTKSFKISSAAYDSYVSGKTRKYFYKEIFGGIK